MRTCGANPSSLHPDSTAAEWLKDMCLLEDNVEWLNSVHRRPRDVEVGGGRGPAEYGVENAFYSKDKKSTAMCCEYVDASMRGGAGKYDDPDAAGEFAYSVLDCTMPHEVGHALIDVYGLPTTGMEEYADDQFSALIQSRTYGDYDPYFETGQVMMLDMSEWWRYVSEYREASHWVVHSLNERRFYNIACYAYGADPEYNADLVGLDYLPHSRAKTCPGEYEKMSSSWDRLLDGYLVE